MTKSLDATPDRKAIESGRPDDGWSPAVKATATAAVLFLGWLAIGQWVSSWLAIGIAGVFLLARAATRSRRRSPSRSLARVERTPLRRRH